MCKTAITLLMVLAGPSAAIHLRRDASDAGEKSKILDLSHTYQHAPMYSHYLTSLLSDAPILESSELPMPSLLNAKGAKGKTFRTENCSSSKLILPCDYNPDSKKDVTCFKDKQMQTMPFSGKAKIACMIYSHKKNRQLQRESFISWGQDCDEFLAFSDETWEDKEAGFTTIEVHPKHGTEANLVGKLREAFKVVQKRVDSGELDFDALVVSGDDAFWLMPNLRYEMETNQEVINASQHKGFLYGHIFLDRHRSFASGAGYVMDKKALKSYVNDKANLKITAWNEDVVLAESMYFHQIPMLHAQEESGEILIHMFTPWAMMLNTLYTQPGWVGGYEKPWLGRMKGKRGAELISRRSILFHYTRGQRYELYNHLYAFPTCGKYAFEEPECKYQRTVRA